MFKTTKQRPLAELLSLAACSALFLYAENVLQQKIAALVLIVAGWTSYLGYRLYREPETLQRWGIRSDNLIRSINVNALVLFLGVIVLALYRYAMGWISLPTRSLLVFLLYPIWGFTQQFALQGLVVTNLEELDVPVIVTVLIGAAGFGLVHLPDLTLALVTAGAGLIWIPVFLYARNIIPLAFTHSWLGTLTFYWILERNPVRELNLF